MDIDYHRSTNPCPLRGAFLSQGAARLNFVALLLWLNHHKWQRWLALTMYTTLTLSTILPRSVLAQSDDETLLGSSQLIYSLSSPLSEPTSEPLTESAEALLSETSHPNAFAFSALPIETQVDMQISGWVNRVQVKQFFHNDTAQWLNGMYLFPLPHDAAIDSMTLHIGERRLQGEIFPKAEAKQQFEQAKTSGKQASLLEQQRPNMFTTQVANLAPGETLVVEIAYQQLVNYQAGEFSLRFPLAITPRYDNDPAVTSSPANGNGTYAQAKLLAAKKVGSASSVGKVNLNIHLDAGLPLASIDAPYHRLKQASLEQGITALQLTQTLAADKDFVLRWRPELTQAPTAVAFAQSGKTHRRTTAEDTVLADKQGSENDYAIVMVMPPQAEHAEKMARELLLVIDTSGSMHGDSMAQAKSALQYALAGLTPADTFNVIAFESTVQTLSTSSLPATAVNLGLANQFIQNLVADGGTEMAPALLRAFAHTSPDELQPSRDTRLKQVVFITDGAIANEQQLFELIADHIGDSRLFTVGIGAAPNGFFMQRAAQTGRGTYTYVGKLDEVSTQVGQLLAKIEHPLVSNIDLRLSDGTIPDYWPVNIGDLYLGEPVMVAVKLKSNQHQYQSDELIVSGNFGGSQWQRRVGLQRDDKAKGLDLIWARKQIEALMLSKNSSNVERVKRQVTQIALDHHLVSPYTSLVAVDNRVVRPAEQMSLDGIASTLLPQASMGQWPQTASESRLFLAIGSMLLLLLGAYWVSYAGVMQRGLLMCLQRIRGKRCQYR